MLAAVLSLDAPYMQRALAELLLLSVPAGLLGTWIVLRRMAFFGHAVGTATFPGLVLADAWGIPAQPVALATGLGFAGGVRRTGSDVATALGLVAMLALGIVLASDVYESGGGVDRLLFGSLLALSDLDLWLTAGVAALAVMGNLALRRTWLASGFDGTGQGDAALLVLVAAAVVVALSAVGALLVTAALVVPAATVRLLTDRMRTLQAGAVALAAAEGVAALALAEALNVGPGAALAAVAAGCFGIVAVTAAVVRR